MTRGEVHEREQSDCQSAATGDDRAMSEVTVSVDPADIRPSRFAVLARDVATMGLGTALAAVFNTLLVFLVPRIVTVEDFGYWRLFMLYGTYVGLLQLGFLDGTLLRWAGRPLADFHDELRPSLKFLLWQLIVLIVPIGVVAWWKFHIDVRFIAIAVLIYAVIYNVSALLLNGLQSARQFKPVAIVAAAPTGLFVVFTFLWNLRQVPNFRISIELYCIAWAGALVYLWAQVRPLKNSGRLVSAWSIGESCVLVGWPIALSNIGSGLVQSADRLVASWMFPIHQFAQYSLASSAMFVPVMAIAAIYRVFFSHAAALQHEGRTRIYGHGSRFLLLAWSAMLPYFFVLELIVKHVLPKCEFPCRPPESVVRHLLSRRNTDFAHELCLYLRQAKRLSSAYDRGRRSDVHHWTYDGDFIRFSDSHCSRPTCVPGNLVVGQRLGAPCHDRTELGEPVDLAGGLCLVRH